MSPGDPLHGHCSIYPREDAAVEGPKCRIGGIQMFLTSPEVLGLGWILDSILLCAQSEPMNWQDNFDRETWSIAKLLYSYLEYVEFDDFEAIVGILQHLQTCNYCSIAGLDHKILRRILSMLGQYAEYEDCHLISSLLNNIN